ncbi:hypothetical protein EP7_001673 [Isosphaeraceae bacterium EP7]
MFVRFVAGTEGENAFWLDGVFTVARLKDEAGELFSHESAMLSEIFAWFNENLPCPPFGRKLTSGEWSIDAVSWFRDDAGEPLRRMWDLVVILREHGTPVRLITTERPGTIVYRDKYQVVAETPPWK